MMPMIDLLRARFVVAALSAVVLMWCAFPARSQDLSSGERRVAINGIERSYIVHIPQNVSHPAPVVLVFHGHRGTPEGIARKSGMADLADQNGFIAVFPAGSQTATTKDGGTWNVGGRVHRGSSTDDVAFVRAILQDLERTSPIDHARIYAVGHSMGGVFAYRLACEMSDTFAAIAAVSATMVEDPCKPSSPVAVLHIHGTNDEVIPIKGGRSATTAPNSPWPAPQQGISAWTQYDSCAGQPIHDHDGSTSCTTYGQCRAAVEYCVIAGGEHPWPPGASERVWAFFASHKKDQH